MFSHSVADARKTLEPAADHSGAPLDAEHAKKPPAPAPPYLPYADESSPGEVPYKPYAEESAPSAPAYEPYKDI